MISPINLEIFLIALLPYLVHGYDPKSDHLNDVYFEVIEPSKPLSVHPSLLTPTVCLCFQRRSAIHSVVDRPKISVLVSWVRQQASETSMSSNGMFSPAEQVLMPCQALNEAFVVFLLPFVGSIIERHLSRSFETAWSLQSAGESASTTRKHRAGWAWVRPEMKSGWDGVRPSMVSSLLEVVHLWPNCSSLKKPVLSAWSSWTMIVQQTIVSWIWSMITANEPYTFRECFFNIEMGMTPRCDVRNEGDG